MLALFASVFFVAAAEQGLLAFNNVSKAKIVAALKNPLSLFADRSPGARGEGPLRLTKSGPHERVLASVRERSPAADTPISDSAPSSAAGPETVSPLADASPAAFSRPLDIGRVPFTPIFYDDTPIGYPGSPGTPPGGGTPPGDDKPPIATLEPSAWTMMGFGLFAVAGAQFRRARKQIA